MALPCFSTRELANATKRDDIIKQTADQIIKDFGEFSIDIVFSGDTGTFYDELSSQMIVHVESLLRNSNSRLLPLLYRIDIRENDIELYEREMKGRTYPEIITELIIHRELKKVLTRDYFRQNRD